MWLLEKIGQQSLRLPDSINPGSGSILTLYISAIKLTITVHKSVYRIIAAHTEGSIHLLSKLCHFMLSYSVLCLSYVAFIRVSCKNGTNYLKL